MACDCRHFQPRPDPSHHGVTEQLQSPCRKTDSETALVEGDL